MEPVLLRPGRLSLSDLRSLYRGAPVSLDPIARADVEAGAAALRALTPVLTAEAEEGGVSAEQATDDGNGEQVQAGVVRLILAIKLNSLGQGFSGVRWAVLERIAGMLSAAGFPSLRGELRDDAAVMARLADELSATLGDPAGAPLTITSAERSALVSGTQVPAAFALAGLFEAERVFQSALVSSALAIAALGGHGSRHPRIHKLHGYAGEMEVAGAIGSLAPAATEAGLEWGPDIARLGACLDLLRQAGATLQLAANAVSEDRLVFWFSQQTATGFGATASIALAADMIAAALREIGGLTQPRVARIAGRSGQDGDASGRAGAVWETMVATFTGENERRACPNTSRDGAENAEADALSAGARRLLPMAGTTTLLVAIELLETSRVINPAAVSESALGSVLELLKTTQPAPNAVLGMPAGSLAGAADLVRSGAIIEAAATPLPGLAPSPQTKAPAPAGAGAMLDEADTYARITKAV